MTKVHESPQSLECMANSPLYS